MIRLLLRPPHFECDTPAEAAKLARIVRVSSDRPLIEVVDGASAKTKRCGCCKTNFSTVDPSDRASSRCRKCRPKPARRSAGSARPARLVHTPPLAPIQTPKPVVVFAPQHGPRPCSSCGVDTPEFELMRGECRECAPIGAVK